MQNKLNYTKKNGFNDHKNKKILHLYTNKDTRNIFGQHCNFKVLYLVGKIKKMFFC